ncbi:DUF4306 domain-containing protein [Paenisporosarcina sp. FSL H8-0542]|uniref:DUF4306 domain-containing protein n=1 Tax=Paenisporosarcina sp. FSL H8-0542 TaxID=2921401 RepID=UPI00315A06C8
MSFKIIIHLSVASMAFIFSALASWYEGSKILDVSWEWKHTAIFSEMLNGPVKQASDILTIDYFVYAAKFLPTFPLIMLFSSTYILILLGYILLKRNDKLFSYFLTSIGVIFLVLSGFVSNSPTIGLKYFFISFLLLGMISIVIALNRFINNKTREIY